MFQSQLEIEKNEPEMLAIFHKIFDNYIDTILLFKPRFVAHSLMADITIIFITGNKIFRSVLYK